MRKTLILCLLWMALLPGLSQADMLKIGDKVPDFTLVDQEGRKTALSDFTGKGIVVTFLYTQCPFPDKCPMIGRKLTSLARLVDKIGRDKEIQILAITLDPARDKPEVLKAYAQGFDKDRSDWRFLTGTEEEIAQVAGAFGVLYWDEKGIIEHNLRTGFIGPDGVLKILKSGSQWRSGEFAAEIEAKLK